jgi:hypothetical protein
VTGFKLPAVQRLQFFLSESVRDPGRVNARRRLELLLSSPVTGAATGQIVLQQAAHPPEES